MTTQTEGAQDTGEITREQILNDRVAMLDELAQFLDTVDAAGEKDSARTAAVTILDKIETIRSCANRELISIRRQR